MRTALRRGVYLVTRETADTGGLLAVVKAALRGHTVLVQYRDKSTDTDRRREQAAALVALCRRYGAPLIINDDIELAAQVGAAGVHLGEQDGQLQDARARLGSKAIIGVSCYNDLQRAERLAAQGASYLAFGSFFASPSKPLTRRVSISLLTAAARFKLPRVAIGGITGENAAPLVAAGADLLAVISNIFDAPDPTAAAQRISDLYYPPDHPLR